jgi:ribonuclease HII
VDEGIAGMAILVGIDEAGYGPILGPLVVSLTAFSLPEKLLGADLWRLLDRSVSRKTKKSAGRLIIDDSKKVYRRPADIGALARSVLSCLKCLERAPDSVGEMLEILCPDCVNRLSEYPWYQSLWTSRLHCEACDIAIASRVLVNNLKSRGIALVGMRSYCLDVAHYNRMVTASRNKAKVLFSGVSGLIKEVFETLPERNLQIIVDRQSGRLRYTSTLRRSFADMRLEVLREDRQASSYELSRDGRRMRLHFIVDADDKFLPVSLASMVSKYLRELMVSCMNRYFISFHSELKPTAGYWKDGLRFIEDLRKNIPAVSYRREQLIRSR